MPHSLAVPRLLSSTLTPFLYPCLLEPCSTVSRRTAPATLRSTLRKRPDHRSHSDLSITVEPNQSHDQALDHSHHLNPAPNDYSAAPFTDACTLTIKAGGGGHGCISFLREKYVANGPPNGGDGGTGGSIYIQAVRGETSLHKLARKGTLSAARGKNGQGSMKGGARGEDILITVPVGTVVRELSRLDPLEEEERQQRASLKDNQTPPDDPVEGSENSTPKLQRNKWLLYPGEMPKSFTTADLPPLPPLRRNPLASLEKSKPLRLDLDTPMETPLLLAAGALGGMGNTHFVTKSRLRPKYATKGDNGVRIRLQLELKLLADVALVGLPNAGKSTLLRALTRSRTRVGNWAFTTLNPNIGTLVLDTHVGRPAVDIQGRRKEPRTNLAIADVPGLIEDAHLDRGLGLGFLRHIERAAVLAFVIDLSTRDAVEALKSLWREVGEYERMREQALNTETLRFHPQEDGMLAYKPFEGSISSNLEPESADDASDSLLEPPADRQLPTLSFPPITSKPWLVVATKADLPETRENFLRLRRYLQEVQEGTKPHPGGKENGWRRMLYSVPVSAIHKEGVEVLPRIFLQLLDD